MVSGTYVCDSACKHCRKTDIPMHRCYQTNSSGTSNEANIRKLQGEDQDPQHLRESSAKPAWEKVATTKYYWAWWGILQLEDNILYCWWEKADSTKKHWQRAMLKRWAAILSWMHNSPSGNYLNVKKTFSRLSVLLCQSCVMWHMC